jgi:hypothetical protein
VKSPPGNDDFLADAAAIPVEGGYELLAVPGVGTISARRPRPRSAAALAQTGNGSVSDADRVEHMHLFLAEHVEPDDYESLLLRMIDGDLGTTTIMRVMKGVATWGTARPYPAVINLVVITAHHWRSMRAKLAQTGIADPLRTMTSMHALLDYTEQITLESLAKSGTGPNAADKSQRAVDDFMFKLYAPDPNERDEDGRVPIPAGFDVGAMEGNFDAMARLAGG